MDQIKLKKDIIISQHCQRNFDLTKTMPQEDIDTIIHSVTNCPSKQNLAFYDVVAIQDRKIIEEIHEATLDRKGRRTNPQVLGNLLLIFTERNILSNFLEADNTVKTEQSGNRGRLNKKMIRNAEILEIANNINVEKNLKSLKTDADIALGIASGYCTLVASQLGYRTGCSSCMDENKVAEILQTKAIYGKPKLLMGIGFNDGERNRREHHTTGELIESMVKVPINVNWIN
jgi:nitroreductase